MWRRLTARHGQEFVKHIVPAILKPARALWNELIGFIFLCFGTAFGFRAARLALDYSKANPADAFAHLLRLVVAGICTVVMLWFGLTSFLRARKISRS